MRKLGMLVVCAAVAAVVSGCGSGGDAAKPADGQTPDGAKEKVIGAALLTQTHIFYQDMIAEMREEAARHGFKLKTQFAEFDGRRQNDQMEMFIAQGVDAIILAPTDSSGITPVVADARAKGIPVFTADIAAKGADVVCHIASDNYKGGKILAEFLVKQLNGQGKIAIVDHPSVTSVQDRTAGFTDEIAKSPGIQIVARVPGEGQRDKALRVTQDLLQANPDLAAIFGINDDSALGALAAVEAAGLQDKIIIVGFDGTPEAADAIRAGKALKADAVQYPREIGKATIQTIADHFNGVELPKERPVDVGLITKESLEGAAAGG
ncbi:MAG TPA: substrate-binding domain-containing protein [Candidatus Hydrogenedentes bacterium]|nr:substrate-binding domain-containing protein [Candidatus Hydrogenedentota bacterium]HQL95857.1 substrate-binding domain-containing protein [Candidatus Hydrogenedentota bacterium]HRZ82616.1 substrate-binding domain-containing protein [Candidatus Hydrogenedentota bacterium]